MYIGIDIGGTKTLVSALTNAGVITESFKFPTPKDYDEWKRQLKASIENLHTQGFIAGTVAVPGTIDRSAGTLISLGNLGWKDLPIVKDVHAITDCPMYMENDAKLGGLSEAMVLKHQYNRVLYITISTGIGIGLVVDQRIGEAALTLPEPGPGRYRLRIRATDPDGGVSPWSGIQHLQSLHLLPVWSLSAPAVKNP